MSVYDKSREDLIKMVRELEDKLITKDQELSKLRSSNSLDSTKIRQMIEDALKTDKKQELSKETRDILDKTVDLILEYAKRVKF